MTVAPAWLDAFRAGAAAIQEAASAGRLDARVRWCPGVDVAETLRHLGVVHRVVRSWVLDGHRPPEAPDLPAGTDVRQWFGTGWTALHATLAELDPAAETSTWCAYDSTAAFWWRRMCHETGVHAFDVLDAVGWTWPVPDPIALDGVDEALRLWLGVALGPAVGGSGQVVRLDTGRRSWTVGLNQRNVEVNHLPVPADATVTAPAPVLYRWLWGRAADSDVTIQGDVTAVAALRVALARAMR